EYDGRLALASDAVEDGGAGLGGGVGHPPRLLNRALAVAARSDDDRPLPAPDRRDRVLKRHVAGAALADREGGGAGLGRASRRGEEEEECDRLSHPLPLALRSHEVEGQRRLTGAAPQGGTGCGAFANRGWGGASAPLPPAARGGGPRNLRAGHGR